MFMKRSYQSLEYLEIWDEDTCFTRKGLAVLAECGAPNLQELCIVPETDDRTPSPNVLSRLLLACPRLHYIKLKCFNLWGNCIYQVLGKLQHLSQLYLVHNANHAIDEAQNSNGNNNSVQLVEACYNNEIYKPETPKGAAGLFEQTKSLWSLHIDCSYPYHVDQTAMDTATYTGKCSSLCKLDIRAPTQPMDEKELKAFVLLPHLESLKICDHGRILGKTLDKKKHCYGYSENTKELTLLCYNDIEFMGHFERMENSVINIFCSQDF
ncbi:hypothetical protein BDA99DRAFT_538782 [Phascolomyces articulosus]|uniref:Uncharacterized protein n=1 Tax=Phascolomyces articulosus TaxID=60185 RepID=A0AAD5JX62_9FUNG|nr:hypothetical protein BDA99DRAFT_538782 [Phascolomyces articulosus]